MIEILAIFFWKWKMITPYTEVLASTQTLNYTKDEILIFFPFLNLKYYPNFLKIFRDDSCSYLKHTANLLKNRIEIASYRFFTNCAQNCKFAKLGLGIFERFSNTNWGPKITEKILEISRSPNFNIFENISKFAEYILVDISNTVQNFLIIKYKLH